MPSKRSWTYWCSRGLVTSFAGFGLLATSSAFHCATDARYSSLPPRVAALRVSSRETVEGLRLMRHAVLPYTNVLGPQQSNFFSLRERQISCGHRFGHKQWHAATMPEPTSAYRLRHGDHFGRSLARHPGRNLLPELSLHFSPKRRRTRRTYRSSPRQLLHPPCGSPHKHFHD